MGFKTQDFHPVFPWIYEMINKPYHWHHTAHFVRIDHLSKKMTLVGSNAIFCDLYWALDKFNIISQLSPKKVPTFSKKVWIFVLEVWHR